MLPLQEGSIRGFPPLSDEELAAEGIENPRPIVNPMRITLDRDETGEIRVYCTMCMHVVGPPLDWDITGTAFDVLIRHVNNGHDGQATHEVG